jgi:hypothetical protein
MTGTAWQADRHTAVGVLQKRTDLSGHRVVDHHVEASELVNGGRHHGRHSLLGADVGHADPCLAARRRHRLSHPLGSWLVDVDEQDSTALGGEAVNARFTDT